MAGVLGRGRGLTVDTLEDSSELPVPGLTPQLQGPPKTASPVPGNKNNLPVASLPHGHQVQLSQDADVKSDDTHNKQDIQKSPDDRLDKHQGKPNTEVLALEQTLARPGAHNEGSMGGMANNQGTKYHEHIKKGEHYRKPVHKGKGDGYNVKSGHQGKKGSHGNYKSRHSPIENPNMSQGNVSISQTRNPYVPVQQQYNNQQLEQLQQENEMQQLQMKEHQLKQQQFQLQQMQQVQQENMKSMDAHQKEELLKRQVQLQMLQENQIKLVQMQQKQLKLEHFQPQTEQQLQQKQHQLMQLQEEQIRLQQVQMQHLDQQQQREQRHKVEEQQRLANKQVSDFYQSQAMSTEQILQQYGSQGVICGRGKRLEELTKRAQEQGRQRPPGPQQQQRKSAQSNPSYGIRMAQPGYMVKEEMGRLSSQEEQVGIYDHAYEGTGYERRPYGKQDDKHYTHKQETKHSPQGSIPSPTLRTSPQMQSLMPNQQNKSLDGSFVLPDAPSVEMVQQSDNIDLPPGIPTHLPPPPLHGGMGLPPPSAVPAAPNMGPLDYMSLGGGYSTSDMGPYQGTSPPKQQRGQYKYQALKGQSPVEGQGMYYNKKGPLKSVHQLGQQQQQPQYKGQQPGQKGQSGATKSNKKQQMQPSSTPPKASLSTEEKKNEYEWQKFKIIRKVKKSLEGVKEGEEEDCAKIIIKIMQEESQRLANYPWPKEQYVAVAEIVQKALDSCKAETHKLLAKLLLVLYKLHPENLCTDLRKAIIEKHQLYVKVSPATNAEKLLDSSVSFLLEVYFIANQADDQIEFKDIITNLVLSLITKWIVYDAEDTELAEVYSYCLIAFFRVLGPHFDEETDKKFYATIRESQLKGKNRAMREGLLDLLLFQNTGWKTEPVRPEKSLDIPTEISNNLDQDQNQEVDAQKRISEEGGDKKDNALVQNQKVVCNEDGTKEKTDEDAREESYGVDPAHTGVKESSVERQTEAPCGGESNTCSDVSLDKKPGRSGSTRDEGNKTATKDCMDYQVSSDTTMEYTVSLTLAQQSLDYQVSSDTTMECTVSHTLAEQSLDNVEKVIDKKHMSSDDIKDLEPGGDEPIDDTSYTTSEQVLSKDDDNSMKEQSDITLELNEGWNPNTDLVPSESYTDSNEWADDILPEVTAINQEVYMAYATEDLGGGYAEGNPDSTSHNITDAKQPPGAYPHTSRSTKQDASMELKVSVYQSAPFLKGHARKVSLQSKNSYFEMDGAGDGSRSGAIPKECGKMNDDCIYSRQYTGAEFVDETNKDPYVAAGSVYQMNSGEAGIEDQEWIAYNASPEEDENITSSDPAEWYNEKIGPMLVRHTYCGPQPQIKSKIAEARQDSKISGTAAGCALCGSHQHSTRQCQTVKIYAPSLHLKTADKPLLTQPKQQSQFGQKVFCSHCGKVGHISYSCPSREQGQFNFFKRKFKNIND